MAKKIIRTLKLELYFLILFLVYNVQLNLANHIEEGKRRRPVPLRSQNNFNWEEIPEKAQKMLQYRQNPRTADNGVHISTTGEKMSDIFYDVYFSLLEGPVTQKKIPQDNGRTRRYGPVVGIQGQLRRFQTR